MREAVVVTGVTRGDRGGGFGDAICPQTVADAGPVGQTQTEHPVLLQCQPKVIQCDHVF
jgi:hypothetical protein